MDPGRLRVSVSGRLLDIGPRAPLLRDLRLATDSDGMALEWSEARYLGEAVAFTIHNSV